ncbi:MAG: response regulator [Desulfobulbaceae bacterium]|nr:response regulator [Desulfobulbaceae bacterium]
MFSLSDPVRKHLNLKILLVLTVAVALVMAAVITLSVRNQRDQIKARMTEYGHELKSLAYAGIKNPMSVGDSETVEKQLLDMRNQLHGTEIVICDFNLQIVFATNADRVNTPVSQFLHNPGAVDALARLLETGDPAFEMPFEEEVEGKKYLVTIHSILNEKECHHCHGESRKVLGSLLTRHSTDGFYVTISTLRNRTIAVSVIGIGVIVLLIYFMLARLVTRPVAELAAKAEQLAAGDLAVSVPVRTEDAIGTLGNAFNSMVGSIKEQIEFANSMKEAIADPLFIVNLDMVVTYMNEACAQLTGYTREETEGILSCREIFQSDICEISCPVQHSFEKGKHIKDITATIVDRSGDNIPIMTSASPLKDAQGQIVGAVVICKDIRSVLEAERLQYVKKTAEREEEQRRYLEKKAAALIDVLARASEGNLQVRVESAEQEGIMDLLGQHTNHMLDNLEKLYNKISSFSRELELEVAKRTMMLRERTLLLEQANRELRELDRLKSSFLANMSHELRTPMNSIIGYTDLLLDGVDGEINEEQEKSLQKVANNSRHLLQLINDILDMSKIESGKIELAPRETDITRLVEAAVATFKPAMESKNLTVAYDFSDDLQPVYVDQDKTRQILNNLLSNAVKFTEQGKITIHAHPSDIGVKQGEAPMFMEICVEDTGIGIKQKDMDKLFDKFSQIDVSSIREYEGTGLGLSIARGLVVLHKGMIWAESEFGKGTKMHFTLPVEKKMFEKPAEPVIEPLMAEKLSEYFKQPAETFLQAPTYGDKPVLCWEYTRCGQTSCPGYESREHRCWLIPGTHSKGTGLAGYPDKVEFCRACEIIDHLVIGKEEIKTDPVAAAQDPDRKTVLVIDDNPEVIDLVKKNIGSDYNIVGLLNSEEAVAMAIAVSPDIITLDIMMPGRNGWQVLRDLKDNPKTQDIPVIILSILDEKNIGFSLGAAEYIVKPVDRNILLQKLKNLEKIVRIKKVLIVDHDAAARELINNVLRQAGLETTAAADSRQALASVNSERPDMIILNLIMPDPDAEFDLIEKIKTNENTKDIPFILITEKDLDREEIARLNGGIRAILNKGLLAEHDLLKELREIIGKM